MSKRTLLILPFLLVLSLLVTAVPSQACTATCTGGSCSGTGSCGCVDGDPVCKDSDTIGDHSTTAGMNAYIDKLAAMDQDALQPAIAHAQSMLYAMEAGDLAAYLEAETAHRQTLQQLPLDVLKRLSNLPQLQ